MKFVARVLLSTENILGVKSVAGECLLDDEDRKENYFLRTKKQHARPTDPSEAG